MGSQMDMHTCTDVGACSNQGVGPEDGLLRHAQRFTCLHTTCEGLCSDIVSHKHGY